MAFTYDALGNRQGSNQLASRGSSWNWFTRTDNGLNQYTNWTPSVINYDDDLGPPWGSPAQANGVMMQDGYVTASYDALNQPRAVYSPGVAPTNGVTNFMWFGFDPLGRCVKRWLASGTGGAANTNPATYFYYEGWNLLQEGPASGGWIWNGSAFVMETGGGMAKCYLHGARVDEIVMSAVMPSGALTFHHYDARGHAILLSDQGGSVVEQYDYDAFGKPYFYTGSGTSLPNGSNCGNRFLFTGREWLSEVKLYDYRNRLYQPELGRFLQPDPKEFEGGDYNLYRYCHNDPVNRSDPTGLRTEIAVEFFKYRPVLGSNIPELFRVFTVVFSSEIGGNHANQNPGSHLKAGLTANDAKAHGKTEATPWVRQLGSNKLEANLKIDWWLHPDAVAKFGYANLARTEKEHTYGGDYKIKGLIEKGGFWDQERSRIQSIDVFRFRDSDYAAQKLTNQIGSDLREYQQAQKIEMDAAGGSHRLPPF